MHEPSPFRLVDPVFSAILLRACADPADLAQTLSAEDIAAGNRCSVAKGLAALEPLWSEPHGQYPCRDRMTGALIDTPFVGGLLDVFAAIPPARAVRIAATIEGHGTCYRVASHPLGVVAERWLEA